MDEDALPAVELERNADIATANKLKIAIEFQRSRKRSKDFQGFSCMLLKSTEKKCCQKQTAPESYHWSYLNRFPVASHSCTEPLQVTSTPAVTFHIPRVNLQRTVMHLRSQRFKIQTAQVYTSYIFVPSPPQDPCMVKETKIWKHRTSLHRSFTLDFAVCIHRKSYRIQHTSELLDSFAAAIFGAALGRKVASCILLLPENLKNMQEKEKTAATMLPSSDLYQDPCSKFPRTPESEICGWAPVL